MRWDVAGLVLAFWFVASQPRVAVGAEKGHNDVSDFVLNGMKSNRGRIVQGVFRAYGESEKSVGDVVSATRVDLECFCAFDFSKGLLRFDCTAMPAKSDKGGTHPGSGGGRRLERDRAVDRKYAQTPEHSFQWWNQNAGQVFRSGLSERPSSDFPPFDVRCLGLVSETDIQIGMTFPTLSELLTSQEIVEAEAVENGIYRLVWKFGPDGRLKRSVWFDSNQGFSPIRTEIQDGEATTGRATRVDVSWEYKSEVWVPQSVVMATLLMPLSNKLSYRLEWESVNQDVDESLFTPEGFGLKDGTELVSNERGSIIKLGVIGPVDARTTQSANSSSGPSGAKTPPPEKD